MLCFFVHINNNLMMTTAQDLVTAQTNVDDVAVNTYLKIL